MTEKEVAELRRRFRQDKNSITHIRGCYVNDRGACPARWGRTFWMWPFPMSR